MLCRPRKLRITYSYLDDVADAAGTVLYTLTLLGVSLPNKEKVMRAISRPWNSWWSHLSRPRKVCVINGGILFVGREVPRSLPGSLMLGAALG